MLQRFLLVVLIAMVVIGPLRAANQDNPPAVSTAREADARRHAPEAAGAARVEHANVLREGLHEELVRLAHPPRERRHA